MRRPLGAQSAPFRKGGRVTVEPQRVVNGSVAGLFNTIMMFWTGHQRPASMVLKEQKANTLRKFKVLRRMRDDALAIRALFGEQIVDIERLGRALHAGWKESASSGRRSPIGKLTLGTSAPWQRALKVAKSAAPVAAVL